MTKLVNYAHISSFETNLVVKFNVDYQPRYIFRNVEGTTTTMSDKSYSYHTAPTGQESLLIITEKVIEVQSHKAVCCRRS